MTKGDFAVQQEEDSVGASHLARIGLVSIAIGAIGVFLAGAILVLREGSLAPTDAGPRGPLPAPSEISHIEQTPIWETRHGEDLEVQQRQELGTWSWADRDAGIARIPIDRAMDIVVREPR